MKLVNNAEKCITQITQADVWILQAHAWRILACMIWSMKMTTYIWFQYVAHWRVSPPSMMKLVKTMLNSTYHYHVPWDSLGEVQSSTLQKTWDSFSCEHKGMIFPLTNDKCMIPKATSSEWITTKCYFSHVGTSFSYHTLDEPLLIRLPTLYWKYDCVVSATTSHQ